MAIQNVLDAVLTGVEIAVADETSVLDGSVILLVPQGFVVTVVEGLPVYFGLLTMECLDWVAVIGFAVYFGLLVV